MTVETMRFNSMLERAVQALFFAALAVVVVATLLPGKDLQVPLTVNDKILHFTAYFGLGILGGTGWPSRRMMFLFAMPLIGLGLEVIQGTLVPGRQFDWLDGVANAVGALAGVSASVLARRILFKRT